MGESSTSSTRRRLVAAAGLTGRDMRRTSAMMSGTWSSTAMRPSSSAAVPAMKGAPLRKSPPQGLTATSRSSDEAVHHQRRAVLAVAHHHRRGAVVAGAAVEAEQRPQGHQRHRFVAVADRQGAEDLQPVIRLDPHHRLHVGGGHAVDVVAQADQQHLHQRQRLRQRAGAMVVPRPTRLVMETEPPSASTFCFTTSMPTPRPDSSLTSSRVEKPGQEDELDGLALGQRRRPGPG